MFTRTKYGADKVVRYLKKNDIRGEAIHGNKSQPQREKAMNAFRKGKIRVLVATDIAARGIDVEGVSHVINFEIPNISETYVHRIGRTGRAGREGVAISMVNEGDERNHMRDIVRLIKRDIPLEKDHQWHLDLPLITADSKTHKVPKEGKNAQGSAKQGRGRRGGHGQPASAQGQPSNRRGCRRTEAPRTIVRASQRAKATARVAPMASAVGTKRPSGKFRGKSPKFRDPSLQGRLILSSSSHGWNASPRVAWRETGPAVPWGPVPRVHATPRRLPLPGQRRRAGASRPTWTMATATSDRHTTPGRGRTAIRPTPTIHPLGNFEQRLEHFSVHAGVLAHVHRIQHGPRDPPRRRGLERSMTQHPRAFRGTVPPFGWAEMRIKSCTHSG